MTTILFDLDGTIIDSTEAILESFGVSFKHFNIKTPSDELIKSLVGHPLEMMYQELDVPSEQIQSIVKVYKKHYRLISREKTILLPNAKEAIEKASKFSTLGIVTTKTKRYSIELLEHLGILKNFSIIIGREDVINPKPHPEPILKAISSLKVKKDFSWMIGDTMMDIESAKAAGIKSCGVLCGYGKFENLNDNVVNLFPTSLEAVSFIKNQ